MAPIRNLEHLSNPLANSSQLAKLVETDTDTDNQSIRFAQYQLTQAAGVLLRLPQEVIATAIVLLQRHQLSTSSPQNQAQSSSRLTSAASIYLAAKLSFTPLSPRSVINVYAYLTSPASPLWFINSSSASAPDTNPPRSRPDPHLYFVSEGVYERDRQLLFSCESAILTSIGFDTHVSLPHTLALTYLQALLGTTSTTRLTDLATRVFEHLNGGLMSPQLLYLTHQPNALAVGAIYLAAREIGVKLVDENWWDVFDVEREDLGFLVLAFGSLGNFAEAEREKWAGRKIDLG